MQSERLPVVFIALIAVAVACVAGMTCDVMDVDAAQYAAMSRDMAVSGDWLHLKVRGVDYLDKPPLIFWFSALSFKVFGVSAFAFRFPSLLFSILAVFSIYKLGKLFHGAQAGWIAALIAASSQAFFTMNQDVKTDMYLTGTVMFTIWQLALFTRGGGWLNLLAGALGLGAGMLAKGPLGVFIPLMAIGGDLVLRRAWKKLFDWKWLAMIPVFVLMLLPFCYGLYQQFGGAGLKFFLWTQSFGRVTGESTWQNNTSAMFLVHSFWWAILPWILLAVPALIYSLIRLIRRRFRIQNEEEAVAICGFVLTFIGLSLSRYKLPHYIFVVIPFMALMIAGMLKNEIQREKVWRIASQFQSAIFLALTLVFCALLLYAFPGPALWVILGCCIFLLAGIIRWLRTRDFIVRLIIPSVFFISGVNLLLNTHFYPAVHQFQTPAIAGKTIHEMNLPPGSVFSFHKSGYALDFYAGYTIPDIPNLRLWKAAPHPADFYVYTDEEGQKDFKSKFGNQAGVMYVWPHRNPAKLSMEFLNPATRDSAITMRYFIHVNEITPPAQ